MSAFIPAVDRLPADNAVAVAIVVALDIIFDFVATACDGAFLQLELIRQADENKMIKYRLFHLSSAGIKAESAIPITIITNSAPANI